MAGGGHRAPTTQRESPRPSLRARGEILSKPKSLLRRREQLGLERISWGDSLQTQLRNENLPLDGLSSRGLCPNAYEAPRDSLQTQQAKREKGTQSKALECQPAFQTSKILIHF
jgi:hypothetical protein